MSASLFASAAAVTVGTDYTTLVQNSGRAGFTGRMNAEVHNSGDVALSGFRLQVKAHFDAEWFTLLEGTDFDATDNPALIVCSATGPHELGAAARANFIADIGNCYAFRLQGKVASGSTTAVARGRVGDN